MSIEWCVSLYLLFLPLPSLLACRPVSSSRSAMTPTAFSRLAVGSLEYISMTGVQRHSNGNQIHVPGTRYRLLPV